MGKNNKLFGEEKIGKLLLKFSIPIIISILVSELYNMVDTFFVGRTIGGSGIGALVMVFPIQRIIIALSIMIAIGTSTALSRANGKEDMETGSKALKNGFSISLLIMAAITVIVFIFSEQILRGLGASGDILKYADQYLRIIIFGSTFLSLTIFISKIMISFGNSRVSITSTSIGAIINVILDIILVVNLDMGIKGAAIATTSSQIIGFLYAYYAYNKIRKENNIPKGFEFDFKFIMPILLIGISAFIIEAEDGILMAVLNNLLASNVGENGIIVLGVISKVYMFLFITMFGIASAMQPIAAYNIGAKNYGRTKKVMKETRKYSFITSTIMWALGIVFAPQLMSIFVREADLIQESARTFRIMISAFPLISIYYVSIFYFQAQGQAKKSIMISFLRQLIIMIPLAIILVKSFNLGAMGVWISYPIADAISGLTSYVLVRREGKRLTIKVNRQIAKEKVA